MIKELLKNSRRRARSSPVKVSTRCFATVAGVSFNNEDGSDRQQIISRCALGDELLLVREPKNRFDPGAIKVTRANGEQVGYVPAGFSLRGDSNRLAHQMDAGKHFRCRISDKYGDGVYGVRIEIMDAE